MKVNGNGPSTIDRARQVTPNKDQRSESKGIKPQIDTGVTEKVAISGRGKDIAKAKELASSSPDIADEARIAKLKAAIEGGHYKVDANAIADKLVDDHLFNSI